MKSAVTSRSARKPLDRATARNAALINQLGTPGLGSLLAGRIWVGLAQLVLMLSGFILVVTWFVLLMLQLYRQMNDGGPSRPIGWIGGTGGLLVVIAWIWALFTSLGLLREARANHPKPQPPPLK